MNEVQEHAVAPKMEEKTKEGVVAVVPPLSAEELATVPPLSAQELAIDPPLSAEELATVPSTLAVLKTLEELQIRTAASYLDPLYFTVSVNGRRYFKSLASTPPSGLLYEGFADGRMPTLIIPSDEDLPTTDVKGLLNAIISILKNQNSPVSLAAASGMWPGAAQILWLVERRAVICMSPIERELYHRWKTGHPSFHAVLEKLDAADRDPTTGSVDWRRRRLPLRHSEGERKRIDVDTLAVQDIFGMLELTSENAKWAVANKPLRDFVTAVAKVHRQIKNLTSGIISIHPADFKEKQAVKFFLTFLGRTLSLHPSALANCRIEHAYCIQYLNERLAKLPLVPGEKLRRGAALFLSKSEMSAVKSELLEARDARLMITSPFGAVSPASTSIPSAVAGLRPASTSVPSAVAGLARAKHKEEQDDSSAVIGITKIPAMPVAAYTKSAKDAAVASRLLARPRGLTDAMLEDVVAVKGE
ncbi:hypothetical protein HDU96_006966 [Phlyctochytrium bullatum]|nr:hypothetical protein HDU96_006966 [Phlyctochytrium bullatum]